MSKNFISDFIAKIQNFIGLNLTTYETMIKKGSDQAKKELEDKGIELKWFRFEMSQFTNGAMAIMLYGEKK